MTTRTFLLAGDSTVATYPAEEHPMSGWGAHLEGHLDGLGSVRNFAKNGATTASFRAEGRWHALLEAATPGDWVLVQFGHNDQKHPELAADLGYAAHLEQFVAEVRDRGAVPVLCTSVERRRFDRGRVLASHGAYPATVRQLGRRLGVDVIDLAVFTSWLYEHHGVVGSRQLFTHLQPGETLHWPDGLVDDTHFSVAGAQAVAGYVARALRPLLGLDADQPARGPALVAVR